MTDEQFTDEIPMAETGEDIAVEWQAPEFIAHQKAPSWYLALAVAGLVFAGLVFLLFRDIVSAIVIIVAAVIFGVYGARRPRMLSLRLDQDGLAVGPKFHPYEEFRSFSVRPESHLFSITLTPHKRFSPYLVIYYEEKDEKDIMAVLASRLPYEEPHGDMVDGLMRKIRF